MDFSEHDLSYKIKDHMVMRRAEVDLLEPEYDSFNEAGELFLGDGKYIFRLTPDDREGLYIAQCEGVLDPDRYDRIMEEAPKVYDDQPFKVLIDFLRSEEAYWNPEKREFLGADDHHFISDTAQRQIRSALADGDSEYKAPAERDWSKIVEKLG